MKQALHIFLKDVRRLWPQILIVAALFALYAFSPLDTGGSGITSLIERGHLQTVLTIIACWMIGARLVHEESPANESPFWITRPYRRRSLLAAKLLFSFVFVLLPLVLCGIVLEARMGASVTANVDVLAAVDLRWTACLILPGLAVGAVSRSLRSFAGSLAGLAVILVVCVNYSARHWTAPLEQRTDVPIVGTWSFAWIVMPMIAAGICAIALQYFLRRTRWSQALLAVSMVTSGFLMPLYGLGPLSLRGLNSGFDPNQIHLSFDENEPPRLEANPTSGRGTCFSAGLRVEGLPTGTVLRAFGTPAAEYRSFYAGVRRNATAILVENENGYREVLCVPNSGTADPESLRASLSFEIVSVTEIARSPVRPGAFRAGNAGRCELPTLFPEDTQLRCDLVEPVTGTIAVGVEYPGYRVYSSTFYPSGSLNLSPMSRGRFDGGSAQRTWGWSGDGALEHPGAQFVLRTERVVGYLRRDLVYREIAFPWTRKR